VQVHVREARGKLPQGATVQVAIGNRALMAEIQINVLSEIEGFIMGKAERDAQTAVICAVDGAFHAVFAISDTSRARHNALLYHNV
jgi:cation transport ATPase